MENKTSIFNRDIFEIPYKFNDYTHLMDGYIQNKCEFELFGILREIPNIFKIEIIAETESLKNGGLRRCWFRLAPKEESKITSAIVTSLLTVILVTPLSTTITKLTEKAIEKYLKTLR